MSPQAHVREAGEGGFMDRKGTFAVRYKEIAEKVMEPKSAASEFKPSLRVVFGLDGKPDDTVSLSVEIEDPADDLWGFVANPDAAPKGNQAALRAWIEQNIVKEPVTVYVDGFIQSRAAPAGTHTFTRIVRIFQYTGKADGKARLGVVAATRDGMTTTFYCPEPRIDKTVGAKSPDDDRIEFGPDPYIFQYLMAFGLDWEKMKKEDLAQAKAYWPGHYDAAGQPVEPLFPSVDDPWPGFLAITERHGWKPVLMEIEPYKDRLSPKQIAKGLVKMGVADASANAEFEREKAVFLENWENLTKLLFAKDDARFLAGTRFTEEGKAVGKTVLRPLVLAHPEAVKARNPDGTPSLKFPPTPDTWTLNGLVVSNFTAERLMRLPEEERFRVVNLADESGAKVLEWAATAVPEWETVGVTEEEAL